MPSQLRFRLTRATLIESEQGRARVAPRRRGSRLLPVLVVAAGVLLALPSGAGARPLVDTVVEHNVTLASEHFPDDICGARAVTETVTNTVQVNHLTENEDGSFHFVDFETGFLFADYDDPAIPDETFRRTNSESFNLTPGGTFTTTDTTQQFSATLRIIDAFHLTEVNGEPKVEHQVFLVRGCP
jgi:hypothetical protein